MVGCRGRWHRRPGADPGFLKGGGGPGADTGFFTSTPPPLDSVRVTSSALRKFEKHPHSWTFTSTPPLDIARVTSSTFQGGGRGDHPCHTHTLDPPLGSILGLPAKRGGGCPTLGPMLKSLHRGPNGGGSGPPPPGSATGRPTCNLT